MIVTLVHRGRNGEETLNALEFLGVDISSAKVLSKDKAHDLQISDDAVIPEILESLREQHGFDYCIQPTENRRKKLLCADMDATIIATETLDELAAFYGIKEKIAAITERAMNGEIDFIAAIHERVACLKGLPVEAMSEVLKNTPINNGAKSLVATMRANGAKTVLISGGFKYFTGGIAEVTGFDEHHGNELEIVDGALSGLVTPPVLFGATKKEILQDYQQKLGLKTDDVLAVGDGANDMLMLQAAGLAVAYYPKPRLRAITKTHIDYTDLRSILYFQGYSDSEIID